MNAPTPNRPWSHILDVTELEILALRIRLFDAERALSERRSLSESGPAVSGCKGGDK